MSAIQYANRTVYPYKLEDPNEECSICTETYHSDPTTPLVKTACNHFFHKQCMEDYAQHKRQSNQDIVCPFRCNDGQSIKNFYRAKIVMPDTSPVPYANNRTVRKDFATDDICTECNETFASNPSAPLTKVIACNHFFHEKCMEIFLAKRGSARCPKDDCHSYGNRDLQRARAKIKEAAPEAPQIKPSAPPAEQSWFNYAKEMALGNLPHQVVARNKETTESIEKIKLQLAKLPRTMFGRQIEDIDGVCATISVCLIKNKDSSESKKLQRITNRIEQMLESLKTEIENSKDGVNIMVEKFKAEMAAPVRA